MGSGGYGASQSGEEKVSQGLVAEAKRTRLDPHVGVRPMLVPETCGNALSDWPSSQRSQTLSGLGLTLRATLAFYVGVG